MGNENRNDSDPFGWHFADGQIDMLRRDGDGSDELAAMTRASMALRWQRKVGDGGTALRKWKLPTTRY